MKKFFTFLFMSGLSLWGSDLFAQDTIVGWKFPSGSADSLADYSVGTLNTSRYISAQYGTSGFPSYHKITISYTADGADGTPDKCAMATGWNDGKDSSFWMTKFKTTGYGTLKLYAKQFSDASGPANYKIQYKLSGSSNPWVDITNGIMTCSNNWTSAVANGLELPAECNNQSGQLSIRWLMISNSDISGGTVTSSGISEIDDIIITGVSLNGVELNNYENFVHIYPNPCHGNFTMDNLKNIKTVKIFDILGKCVFEKENLLNENLNFSNYNKGLYLIQLTTLDNEIYSSKIIVE